jgi:hypothetical protein
MQDGVGGHALQVAPIVVGGDVVDVDEAIEVDADVVDAVEVVDVVDVEVVEVVEPPPPEHKFPVIIKNLKPKLSSDTPNPLYTTYF